MSDWTSGMTKLVINAYQAGQPCDVCFGTVMSTKPLTVVVEDLKLPLGGKQLVIPDYLTDRTIPVTVDGKSGMAVIPEALKAGDRVILVKKTGGQRYVIIGKEV